jgi:hypothetical protein
MNESSTCGFDDFRHILFARFECWFAENYPRSVACHGVSFCVRGILWHDDMGFDSSPSGGKRQGSSMISR